MSENSRFLLEQVHRKSFNFFPNSEQREELKTQYSDSRPMSRYVRSHIIKTLPGISHETKMTFG